MSLSFQGRDHKVKGGAISIAVDSNHKLIKLAQNIPWSHLIDIITPDLKSGCNWRVGRKLDVRLHLSVYILQVVFNLTDRGTETALQGNAYYQVFTGALFIEGWRVPDHTAIEKFRSRLSPETKLTLANAIAGHAAKLGFADPTQVDIDSTVQEANAAYPSDANLMVKLSEKCKKVFEALKEKITFKPQMDIDIKKIKSKAKGYFFLAKNTKTEVRKETFKELHSLIKNQTYPFIKWLEENAQEALKDTKWNIEQAGKQIAGHGKRYLLDVAHFIRTGKVKAGKILSHHLKDIKCIIKGKAGKKQEFGRVFQITRIGGNFATVLPCLDISNSDKTAIKDMLSVHSKTFGKKTKISSVTADKGYYSTQNIKNLLEAEVEDFHLGYEFTDQSQEDYHRLYCRRSGVEPIIGHIKKGGQLGRSRMKSDTSTLGAGYSSVLGFNMRQMMRKLV